METHPLAILKIARGGNQARLLRNILCVDCGLMRFYASRKACGKARKSANRRHASDRPQLLHL